MGFCVLVWDNGDDWRELRDVIQSRCEIAILFDDLFVYKDISGDRKNHILSTSEADRTGRRMRTRSLFQRLPQE